MSTHRRTAAWLTALALTGAGCGTTPTPDENTGPRGSSAEQAAALEGVKSDARNLIADLVVSHATTSTYPSTPEEAGEAFTTLTEGNRIALYSNHANTNVVICVANDTYGAWVRWDAVTGHLGSGTGAGADDIIAGCSAQ